LPVASRLSTASVTGSQAPLRGRFHRRKREDAPKSPCTTAVLKGPTAVPAANALRLYMSGKCWQKTTGKSEALPPLPRRQTRPFRAAVAPFCTAAAPCASARPPTAPARKQHGQARSLPVSNRAIGVNFGLCAFYTLTRSGSRARSCSWTWASSRRVAALSVCSQGRSRSSRPKCP